ncbi:MAG: hypothetical protein GY820_42500 [Gammaproteobacteria bacterium]|nr:hypothetical protein [Gammaproteobacteria bacterium]
MVKARKKSLDGRKAREKSKNRMRSKRAAQTGGEAAQSREKAAEAMRRSRADIADTEAEQHKVRLKKRMQIVRAKRSASETLQKSKYKAEFMQKCRLRRTQSEKAKYDANLRECIKDLRALKTPSEKMQEKLTKKQQMQDLRTKRTMQKDEYRIALKEDAHIDAFNTGPLDVRCKHCDARHFSAEMPINRKLEFKSCCHHGKVKLEKLQPCPEELRMLLDGSSVNSENFKINVRSYNSALAFASLSASLESPKGRGPYTFRIHGQMYHQTGPLHPSEGKSKRYSQLYIVDTDMAATERMGSPANENCLRGVMESLDKLLRRVSPFAKAYKFMWEVEQEEIAKARELGTPPPQLTMVFQTDEGLDPRTYNAPRVNEVAAIFIGEPGEDLSAREIQIHDRSETFMRIPVTNGLCDPMVYPLFFPHGEKGWNMYFS